MRTSLHTPSPDAVRGFPLPRSLALTYATCRSRRLCRVGDLPGYVDEGLLYSVFFATGQLVSVKLIRNRATGLSEGYAFLEFRWVLAGA